MFKVKRQLNFILMIKNFKFIVSVFLFAIIFLVIFSVSPGDLQKKFVIEFLFKDIPVGLIVSTIFFIFTVEIPKISKRRNDLNFVMPYWQNIKNYYFILFEFICHLLNYEKIVPDFTVDTLKRVYLTLLDGQGKNAMDLYTRPIGFGTSVCTRDSTLNEMISQYKSLIKKDIDKLKYFYSLNLSYCDDEIIILEKITSSILLTHIGSFQGMGDTSNTLFQSFEIFNSIYWVKSTTQIKFMSKSELKKHLQVDRLEVVLPKIINIEQKREQIKGKIVIIYNKDDIFHRIIFKELADSYTYCKGFLNTCIVTTYEEIDYNKKYDVLILLVDSSFCIDKLQTLYSNSSKLFVVSSELIHKYQSGKYVLYTYSQEMNEKELGEIRNKISNELDQYFDIKNI